MNAGRTTLGAALVKKDNGYTQHVVIANVTDQGLSQTAAAAASLSQQLPLVRSMILVGIAAGQPDANDPEDDVRLGDVVVSSPSSNTTTSSESRNKKLFVAATTYRRLARHF
jgi:nucleoside phosphorylase